MNGQSYQGTRKASVTTVTTSSTTSSTNGVTMRKSSLTTTSNVQLRRRSQADTAWRGKRASALYEHDDSGEGITAQVNKLRDEREAVQGRTFTKWVNSQLSRHPQGVKIDNLYRDLYDGKNLIRLLHVLSGEHLKIPNTRGRMRIHAMENVQRAIDFLREKQVPMENIGNHDIVDGNHRIILGLIWTVILRFQIQDIVIDTEDSKERRSAKDALLLWSQMKTKGYPNVQVKNFTKSWKDGLALNAIIHRHRPDLVDFNSLATDGSVASNTANLENAFKQAEYLGIARLLEPEDVAVENPDEKSMITYVVSYYHYFNEHAQKEIESSRIGTILDAALAAEAKINNYDQLVTNLLKWIEEKIEELNSRNFENSIDGVKKDLAEFNAYRLQEKPPKFDEKGAIEVLLFDIQSQMRADNRVPWTPAEGKLIADVQKRWDELELAEHARELAIHEELKRQERLEQLAENFFTKAQMREEWLKDVRGLLEKDNFGKNLDAVEAAQKKHEAIEMDFSAYQQRINSMEEKADELEKENYHDIAKIISKKEEISQLWKTLQTDLASRRNRLNRILELQRILQTILLISDAIGETKSILGDHVDSALLEEAISRHALLEKDIEMLGCRKEKCTLEAVGYLEEEDQSFTPKEAADLRPKVEQLKAEYDELIELAKAKSKTLKAKQTLHELQQDLSEMDQWIITKLELLKRICEDKPEDLTEVQRALAAHQLEQGEVSVRKTKLALLAERAHKAEQQTEIEQKWADLSEMMTARAELLEKEQERLQHQQKHAEFVALLGEIKSRIEHSSKPTDDAEVQRQIKAMKAIKDQLVDIKKPLDELQAEAENFEEADVSSSINEHSALVDTVDEKLVYLDKISDAYDFANECEEEEQWCHEKATLLENLSVPDNLEEISVIKTRFDGIREDVDKRSQVVEQLAARGKELNQGGSDAPPELLEGAVSSVQEAWNALQKAMKEKEDKFAHGETLQKFLLDVAQTEMRIGEKAQIIESTKDTGDTLAGVLQLQRKLATMEREVAAVGTTIAYLKAQQQNIADNYPDDAAETSARLEEVKQKFDELNEAVRKREEKLGQAGHVQTFMRDVADFQQWLEKTTSAIASEGHASSLADAERLLAQHELLQEEIEAAKPRYENLKSEGVKQLEQAESVFLTEQLDQMDDSWTKLAALSQNREAALKNELQELKFNSDCAVVEQLLANHEVQLQSVNLPEDPVEAEEAMAKHAENQKVLAGTKERVETIKNASGEFVDKEDVEKRVEKLDNQYVKLVEQSERVEAELRECHDVSSFLRDATEASDWIKEKKLDLESTASHHDEWQKTRALSAELAANQNRLDQLRVRGNALKEQYPSRRKSIDEVLDGLTLEWSQLDDQSNEKEKELFEEHKNEILEKSAADLERFVNEVESKLEKSVEMEDPKDLASCNRLLLDQQRLEDQLDNRRQELNDIKADSGSGMQEKIDQISNRIELLAEPLADRRERIQTAKTFHQLRRNLQDEIIWCDERTQVAQSAEFGESLHQVQKIVKRNQNLLLEIDSHDGRVKSLLEEASKLSEKAETTPEQKDILADLSKELEEKWNSLRRATDDRSKKLDHNVALQRLLFDIENAEQWLTERELIVEQPLKEDSDPEALMRRHLGLAQTVNDFEATIVDLVKQGKELEEEQAMEQLGVLEKQFAKLKALVGDRHHKIDELVKLTKLRRHLDTVERWIKEKEIIASNEDTGDNLESTLILIERWESFTAETKRVGGDKMRDVQAEVDTLIEAAHSDAFKIESWRKNINNMWDDLVELMETRRQLLETTLRRHRYFADADELGSRLAEKREAAENAKDIGGIVNEIQSLEPKINKLKEECESLEPIYAGAQREALTSKLSDVKSDYDETIKAAKSKQAEKETNENKEKFDALVAELSAMLKEIARSLTEADIPRDTAEAEKALGKAENYRNQLNARSKDFDDAKRLASTLDDESKETMEKLLRDREGLEVFLDDQETRLNIACDMLGFLRDAETLESWLKSQNVAESSSDASIEICQKLLEETDRKVGQAKTWEAKIETLKKPTMFEEANRDAIKKAAEEEELLKMKEREEAEKLAEKAKQEEQKSAAVQETRNEEVEQEREIVQSQSVPSEVSNVQNGNELPDSVKTNGMSQSEDLNQSISSKHESSISESTKEAHSATLSTPTKLKTGALSRKFVVINGKSAKDRTWKDTWISIHDDKVAFYKDKKSSESNKNPDPAFPQAQVKVIREQHHKRDFVLKVTCKNTELLLDTGDKARMEQWFVSLGGDPENASLWSAITDNAAASPSPSRSSKSKKRSLFGRKK